MVVDTDVRAYAAINMRTENTAIKQFRRNHNFHLLFFAIQAKASDSVAITDMQRGMLLCAAKTEQISNHFDVSLYLLTKDEGGRSQPMTSKYIQPIFRKTLNIPCRVDIGRFFRTVATAIVTKAHGGV